MKQFLIVLAFCISCSSYQEYYKQKPKIVCASDKNNNFVICDLKLELNTSDWWSYQNYLVIVQYKSNNINKIEYQLLLTFSLKDFYYYDFVNLNIDDKQYVLKPSKLKQDETFGLQEILYFNIKKDFIKILSDANTISIITINGTYNIRDEDMPFIHEFYDSINK